MAYTKAHFLKLRTNPVKFFKSILGVKRIEDYQVKILNAIVKHDKVAIRATHSISKTFTMGRVPLWFLSTYKNSKIITTAPTYRQVAKLLWGELRSAHRNSRQPLGGHLTTTELTIDDDWYAIGYSPKSEAASDSKEQKGSTFQGFHAMHIMVIFDEATGVSPDVWKMVEGLLTSGKTVKFICIGNPTSRTSEFFKCFKSPSWKKFHLSCFDSPNLKANGFINKEKLKQEVDYLKNLSDEGRLQRINSYEKPVPYLLSAQWVVDRLYEWDFDHPLSKTKIFGEFPDEDDNVIVQQSDVENAIAREYFTQEEDIRFIGIDVARFGEDQTVFTELIGEKQTRKKAMGRQGIDVTTKEAMAFIISSHRKTYVLIDGTGLGGGLVDNLRDNKREKLLLKNVFIIEINNGEKCVGKKDQKHYVNKKSKMFVELGKDLKNVLDILDENIYLEELPSIKYKFDKHGRMQMESKDDYKKRTQRPSPDHSDSLALANHGRHNYGNGEFDEEDNLKTTHAETKEMDSDDDRPMASSVDETSW